ncbi:uncharacterized protein LAJ45_07117 [Morchella importuna]|uniref:uncharacterized protein n=1 Tax=Morchella importuna TaxID=1174673 RepID=UPI001E8CCDCE|nr:uncharacterized protein LAJ45_07117 [Morchella importuna]KAH8148774.1 hypothetical protein LAJ45_07117 [Morchella importuna]
MPPTPGNPSTTPKASRDIVHIPPIFQNNAVRNTSNLTASRDSPRTVGRIESPFLASSSQAQSREISPIRRPRESSPPNGGGVISSHRRLNSAQATSNIRELGGIHANGGAPPPVPGHASNRNSTPTPKELFGTQNSFPTLRESGSQPNLPANHPPSFPALRESGSFPAMKDSMQIPGYRSSLDLDKVPSLLPPMRGFKSQESSPPGPSNALAASTFSTSPKESRERDWSKDSQEKEMEDRRRDWERDEVPKFTVHDLETLTSQLSGLTSIANSLQREMANLSRRSKDNATDLISLKEATRSRDEDIRTSLRDLVHSLRNMENDRLNESHNSSVPMITAGSSSSRASSFASDLASSKISTASSKASSIDKPNIEMQALDKILKDMPTKEEQERLRVLLHDVQETLKSQANKVESEKKVLSLLEEFKDREYARGKELAIPGKLPEQAEEKIMAMLHDLRDDLHQREPKEVDRRVLFMLEEIKQKDVEDEERIFSVLEDLKEREGDERIETVLSLLQELKEQGDDAKVLSFLEEIKVRIDSMTTDLEKCVSAIQNKPKSESSPESESRSTDSIASSDHVLEVLNSVKEGVVNGGDIMEEVKSLLEDFVERKGGQDQREAQQILKDLMKEIEVLVTEQRHAIARLNNSSGLPSTALTFNPPLPPDLDNEAAITALANIASTTTRTDITLSSINALIKVFQKDVNHANTHSAESLLSVSRFLDDLQVSMAGVGNTNDQIAKFDGSFSQKVEELLDIQKHMQRILLGNEDEYIWKQDVGVKASVEELRGEVEDMMDRNTESLNESTEKTIEAIKNSNPTPLIEELKTALAAMTERSLQALRDADPNESLKKLRIEIAESAQKTVEAIKHGSSEPTEYFRAEVKDLLEKSLTSIDSKADTEGVTELLISMKRELRELLAKSTASNLSESVEVKLAIQTVNAEMEALLEKSLSSAMSLTSSHADKKTSAAISGLKTEINDIMFKVVTIADKPDSSEKIQESIEILKSEITDLVDKYTTALAPSTIHPEAEEIKACIISLSKDLCDAVERTVALANESSAESNLTIKTTIEELRSDIGELGKSMAAAVTISSASSVEESIKNAFELMRDEVLEKIEKSTASFGMNDKMAAAIEELKKEVNEAVKNSISLAVAAVPEADLINKAHEALERLKEQISNIMDKSLATVGSGPATIRNIVEGLQKEVVEITEKTTSMLAPSVSEKRTKKLLADIRKDIVDMLKETPSPKSSIDAVKKAVDELRRDVLDILEKSISTAPAPASGPDAEATVDPSAVERIESTISELKTDISEMVERSLAAAIANSTFDSEESVKEVIEELKKDVRDILQMSIVPIGPAKEDTVGLVKMALESFKDELGASSTTKDSNGLMEAIIELRTHVTGMMERSKDDEIRGVLEALKIQVERFSGSIAGGAANEGVNALRKEVERLAEKFGSTAKEMKDAVEELKAKESKQLQVLQSSNDVEVKAAIETLASEVKGLGIKDTVDTLKAQIQELSEKSKDEEIKEAIDSLKQDIEQSLDRSISALVTPKSENVPVMKEMIDTLRKELLQSVEKGFGASKDFEAVRELTKAVRELMERPIKFGSDAGSDQPPVFDKVEYRVTDKPGDKADKLKVAVDVLRREFLEMMEKFSGIVSTSVSAPESEQAFEDMRNAAFEVKQATFEVKKSLGLISKGQAEENEAISDISSAVGECRVEVAVVRTLVEEKNTEVKEGVSVVAKAVSESNVEMKELVAEVKDGVEILQTVTTEGILGVSSVVSEFQSETKEGLSGISDSISGFQTETKESIVNINTSITDLKFEVKEDIAGVKHIASEIQLGTTGSINDINKAISGIQTETKEGISDVKGVVEDMKAVVEEEIEAVKKAVEGSKVETKEAAVGIEAKIGASEAGLKAAIEESRSMVQENIDSVNAAVEGYSIEVKEDVFAVKNAVEESHTTTVQEHHKTQKQVQEVMGLVDVLQTEWKGSQPNLFSALLELKHLLRDAQDSIAKKPDSIPPPPAYDDSQTQEKLNILLAAETRTAKHLPQLDLLTSIQRQVSTTSADIAEFLNMQKEVLLEDATSKIDAARQAENDLEKANTEKKIVEAATATLRDEHANLQDSIEVLKDETELLNSRRLKLTAEVAGLETALDLRRDELLLLEARAEGLERRVIEGVIEQSRALLSKPRSNSSRLSKAGVEAIRMKAQHSPIPRASAAPGRRHLSLNEIPGDIPSTTNPTKPTRGISGTILGLGQHEYSASLGLLSRSQSTRSVRGTRKSSWNLKNGRTTSGNEKENERESPVEEEEIDDINGDEGDHVDILRDGLMEEEEEEEEAENGFDEGRRSSSGSVRRFADEEDNKGNESSKRKKNYPALGLDFSGEGIDRRDLNRHRTPSGDSTGP